MRYKSLVLRHLEQVESSINTIIKGMDNNTLSSQDAYYLLKKVQTNLIEVKEKVELEPDER